MRKSALLDTLSNGKNVFHCLPHCLGPAIPGGALPCQTLEAESRFRSQSPLARSQLLLVLALAMHLAVWVAGPIQAGEALSLVGPCIRFDLTTNDFGAVLAGEPVRHVFIFTNAGSEDLVISKVQPGCGCTSAGEWTRVAKPGETGVIPIRLNTAGFVGMIDKAITVTCNDQRQPIVTLKLKGTARRAMVIQPPVAILNLQPDSPLGCAIICITNYLEQPLSLSNPLSTNSALTAELKTNLIGRCYVVVVSNVVPLASGALAANVAVKTSLTNLPVINIPVLANAVPPFTTSPPQLRLALLTNSQVAYIAITSRSTHAVSLSDPEVNADGVEASLQETKPGSPFIAKLTFPPGFKLAAGRNCSFSVRTSHPQCPVVLVPICQTSDTIPAAPWLIGGPRALAACPLPLVYQNEALQVLHLNEDQLQAIDEVKLQFVEAIGGLSQDPRDPAYLARWEKAKPNADAMLARVIGQRAFMRFDMLPAADSSSQ